MKPGAASPTISHVSEDADIIRIPGTCIYYLQASSVQDKLQARDMLLKTAKKITKEFASG